MLITVSNQNIHGGNNEENLDKTHGISVCDSFAVI
jgi:hypothetical protein